MTWPTGAVNTANTDASTDSPANARADFLDLEQKVNQIIAHGAPVLQAGTQTIDGSKTFSSALSVPAGSAAGHAVNKSQMDAADGLKLAKSSNLTDVANPAAALSNLGGVAASAFAGSNQSLTTSGYQKLPGGLIIQWGTLTVANGSQTFPVAFPNAVLALAGVNCNYGPSAGLVVPGASGVTLTGFSGSLRDQSGVFFGGTTDMRWLAVGY